MSVFRFATEVSENIRKKIRVYAVLMVISFLCVGMRVWYLQVIKGEDFMGRSENNRVRQVSLPAYRGTIKDRNGEILVSIRPSFNLYVIPEDAKNLSISLDFLSKRIFFDKERLKANIRQSRSFQSVLMKRDINRKEVAYIEENKMRLPGIHVQIEPLRSYVYKDLAAHVLGYLGEISKNELETPQHAKYQLGDMIGKYGLENIYESVLRGEKGFKNVEVDVSGRELKTLKRFQPESGNNLTLTLDVRVQRKLEEIMQGTPEAPVRGAVVVTKVQTGEIIAMVSKPSFDPNIFAAGISKKKWRGFIRDDRHPLQNRAIDGQYPPGSTYKVVTAYAALAEELIEPESTIFCPGHFQLGKGRYRCWKRGGHGAMNLHDALVQSCDVYFYTLGRQLGVDRLAQYAKKLGLGSRTGIRLAGEKPGLIPSKQWKQKTRNKPWFPGETISASIGQGYNLVTPLQNASLFSTMANGGIQVKPYLVKRVEDSEGNVIRNFFPEIIKNVGIEPEILKHLREALRGVVNAPRGTGHRSKIRDIVVSGKTGTSQVVRMKTSEENKSEDEVPYKFREHAWFVAFAPYEKPDVAVAVIVEHGGHGGVSAAPIARKAFETYFSYYPPSEKTLEKLN
ncbi:MAG: penicillin-binding protein 2 [Desulfobacterales bacterium]|nr:penicillin-binding protein 2 [Desulfobacterales bacterium]